MSCWYYPSRIASSRRVKAASRICASPAAPLPTFEHDGLRPHGLCEIPVNHATSPMSNEYRTVPLELEWCSQHLESCPARALHRSQESERRQHSVGLFIFDLLGYSAAGAATTSSSWANSSASSCTVCRLASLIQSARSAQLTMRFKDFKSYKGHHVLLFGDSYFTSIIGPNGSGKSNS